MTRESREGSRNLSAPFQNGKGNGSRKRMRERAVKVVFLLSACLSILAVGLICLFLLINGLPALKQIGLWDFLSGRTWRPSNDIYGIYPMILGSIYVTAGALLVGVPIGILTAVYLGKFASKISKKLLTPAVELLAGIPSVVYGFSDWCCWCPLCGIPLEETGPAS